METEVTGPTMAQVEISQTLRRWTADNAQSVDAGDIAARDALPQLAAESLIHLGAPRNKCGGLVQQAAVMEALARYSLSVPFGLWGHRMAIEFLELSGGSYAQSVLPALRAGTTPGASAMAPGYKSLAGAGNLDLRLSQADDGTLHLSGRIGWASNLYADAIAVAPAYGPNTTEHNGAQGGVVVAFPLDAPGVQIGPQLEILAMRGTASTYVTLHDVKIRPDQILTSDFSTFLKQTRPTLSILQASLCLGLATAAHEQALHNATGFNKVLLAEIQEHGEQLAMTKQQLIQLASRVGTDQPPIPRDVLALRLEAGQLAGELSTLELKTAGGTGFIKTSDTNRRYREATFIPLQAPSETQLRWELARA
ncbi:MAG: acyl-CoA/acyl-ACP dehydrogenase [Micrococcus sp.]|nr:acyl-CoA/acyl-ACP dehydrogenase [Micrococcus sp.]